MNLIISFLCTTTLIFCQVKTPNNSIRNYTEETFGYDLQFLQKRDSVIVLRNGNACVVVSPKYQGKVFTSTASGYDGYSFGWINYKALASDSLSPHINAYGGEDRMWLGPEGGQFSIFFKPGTEMKFENWQTPAPLDTEPWILISSNISKVVMSKSLKLTNYANTIFTAKLNREITVLGTTQLTQLLGIENTKGLKWVGFETKNSLTNVGTTKWTRETGTLNIWILSMFKPVLEGAAAIPYKQNKNEELGKIATTNYFGEIPAERMKIENGILYFKIDGKHRSKLGLSKQRATPLVASYDGNRKVLTIIQYSLPKTSNGYINQLWEVQKEPFEGDVISSYSDGPLEGEGQIGPFYELETSSPAAFLAPGETITHYNRIFHFIGDEISLSNISIKLLGVSVEQIRTAIR